MLIPVKTAKVAGSVGAMFAALQLTESTGINLGLAVGAIGALWHLGRKLQFLEDAAKQAARDREDMLKVIASLPCSNCTLHIHHKKQ